MSMCADRGLGTGTNGWAQIGVEMIGLAANRRNDRSPPRMFFSPFQRSPGSSLHCESGAKNPRRKDPNPCEGKEQKTCQIHGITTQTYSKCFQPFAAKQNKTDEKHRV
jgi:hypothetical protein